MDSFDLLQKWISWIKSILSVLVNGNPTKEFNVKRGLRQGYPLSPLLFNIIVEVLHLILQKAERMGFFKGVRLDSGPSISYLQFADNTIIFIENTTHSCKGIRQLKLFEILTGLKINYKKSYIYTSKRDHAKAQGLANEIVCELGIWLMTYFGAKLGSSLCRMSFWAPFVKSFKLKLSRWRSNYLNKSGRAVMIRSFLNNIPSHWFQIHQAPKNVIALMEKIKRNFFWNEITEASYYRKLHWICWEKLVLTKDMGGLGLVNLEVKNISLCYTKI